MTTYTGTSGADRFTGTSQGDLFNVGQGGQDTITGGGGDDTISMGAGLTTADRIDGGAGIDTVVLSGAYAKGVTIGPRFLTGVENIRLDDGHAWNLTINDGEYRLDQDYLQIAGPAGTYLRGASEHIDASALTTLSLVIMDSDGNDLIRGGAMGDQIYCRGGGSDTVDGGAGDDYAGEENTSGTLVFTGGDGNDTVSFESGLHAGDHLDGGAGKDALDLGYIDGATLRGAQIHGIETIFLNTQNDQSIKLDDGVATADLEGGMLRVIAAFNYNDERIGIDASAERDTAVSLQGAGGADTLKGGAGNDILDMSNAGPEVDGGDDQAFGNGGDDTFVFGRGTLTGADHIDGGAGYDTLKLDYYSNDIPVKLAAGTLTNIEQIVLTVAYDLTLVDANVGSGRVMQVDASTSTLGGGVQVDGSAETNARFRMLGSIEGDTLHGGRGADTLTGGGGRDLLSGGRGNDHFVYGSLADSTVDNSDLLQDLAKGDIIDLSGIDARTDVAGDQAFTVVRHFDGHAGQAQLAYNANAGETLLSLDVDGDGSADAVINIAGNHATFNGFVL